MFIFITLVINTLILAIGYRFLGYNFALHFSGFKKEEFKQNISSGSSKTHWLACLLIGFIIAIFETILYLKNGRADGCFNSPLAEISWIFKILFGIYFGLRFGTYSCRFLIKDFKSINLYSRKFLKTVPIISITSFLLSTFWYVSVTLSKNCLM